MTPTRPPKRRHFSPSTYPWVYDQNRVCNPELSLREAFGEAFVPQPPSSDRLPKEIRRIQYWKDNIADLHAKYSDAKGRLTGIGRLHARRGPPPMYPQPKMLELARADVESCLRKAREDVEMYEQAMEDLTYLHQRFAAIEHQTEERAHSSRFTAAAAGPANQSSNTSAATTGQANQSSNSAATSSAAQK